MATSSTRKRRAASLTAEALWNIQLEDDVTGNFEQKNKNSKITLREIAKWQRTKTDNKKSLIEATSLLNANHDDKERSSKNSETVVTKACVHGSTVGNSSKISYRFGVKKKPTASVVPLVKSDSGTSYSIAGNTRTGSDKVTGGSQVLLLPISLNPGVDRIGVNNASVPLFTLHPTSVKVDLLQCLDNSRIVNVAPMLTGNSGSHISHSSNDYQARNAHYRRNTHSDNHQYNIRNYQNSSDQTEPLNLKLGESCIPSGTDDSERHFYMKRNSSKSSGWTKHDWAKCNVEKLKLNKTFTKDLSLKTRLLMNSSKPSVTDSSKEWIGYDADSPSSESSCSTDPDDVSMVKIRKKSSQKGLINLRCKAASPTDYLSRSQERHQNAIGRITQKRKRRASEKTDNNGWEFSGKPYDAFVYSVETAKPVLRRCYPSMRRKSESSGNSKFSEGCGDDDVVMVRDCVIMRAEAGEQPYVAKVAALWSHPNSDKMMISLLWFYRPEHIQDVRVLTEKFHDDELFASRHLDEISVACVEDKGFVLTYNQYCRFLASSEKEYEHVGTIDGRDALPIKSNSSKLGNFNISPDTDKSLVYFCRKLYDIKSHRLLKTFPIPTPLFSPNSRAETT